MDLSNYSAYIFDFDGTLVDSMGLWRDIDIEYLGQFNIPYPDDLQTATVGKSFLETAYYFKDRFSIPRSVEDIMSEWESMAYDAYLNHIHFKPGALLLLNELREKNIPMGIATSNTRKVTEAFLKKHRLLAFFNSLSFAMEVGVGKPDPAIFLKAAKDLKIEPNTCIAFEDSYDGVLSAKNAQMTVVAVAEDSQSSMQYKIRKVADFYIKDFTEF